MVRRGIATGTNTFFFMTDEERESLPEGAARPGLLRAGHVAGETLDRAAHDAIGGAEHRRWLLWLKNEGVVADKRVTEMLRRGEEAGLRTRYLIAHRDPWYVLEDIAPPDILLGPMSRSHLPAIWNAVSAIPSNSLYGIYVKGGVETARGLTTWLNRPEGQSSLRSSGRHYGRLYKLEPGDLLRVMVPPTETLAYINSGA